MAAFRPWMVPLSLLLTLACSGDEGGMDSRSAGVDDAKVGVHWRYDAAAPEASAADAQGEAGDTGRADLPPPDAGDGASPPDGTDLSPMDATGEPSADTPEPPPEATEHAPEVQPEVQPEVVAEVIPEVAPDVPPPEVGECSVHAHCDDGVPCTVDTCQPDHTCTHSPVADLGACEDGDVCTTGDFCSGGLCFGGALLDCDDGNACTIDTCTSPAGCQHMPKTGGVCEDGDPCTGGDTCAAGVCKTGTLDLCPVCEDGVCGYPYETCEGCPADCGACAETNCGDGVDEDLDGLTDCADTDCAATADCLPAACEGFVPLTCGDTKTGNPTTNHLGYYSCGGYGSSPDHVFRVVVPAGVAWLKATLTTLGSDEDYDLYILEGPCDPEACVYRKAGSTGTDTQTWSVSPGASWWIVVEEYISGTQGYRLTLTCT